MTVNHVASTSNVVLCRSDGDVVASFFALFILGVELIQHCMVCLLGAGPCSL